MAEVVFQESTYTPPQIAVVVGAFLRAPRAIGHNVLFSDLFSHDSEEQRDYTDGLMVVSIIFTFFFLIWGFVLVVLKMKGNEVGCASGNAFVYHDSEDENIEIEEDKVQDDIGSTSASSEAGSISESSEKPLFSKNGGALSFNSSSSDIDDNNDHSKTKLWRCMQRETGDKDVKINPHERRTRVAFLVFASIAMICTTFTLFLTFGPLKEALTEMTNEDSPDSLFSEVQKSVNDIEASLIALDSLSSEALQLVIEIPTDLEIICPLVDINEFQLYLGVDINGIIRTIIDQQYRLREGVETQFAAHQSFANGVESVLLTVESYANETEKYLMVLPGLLLAIGGLTSIAMAGVVMAWKEKSSVRFQRCMSYIVLPLLILASTTCWVVLMVLSLSTMVGTDICLSGSSHGSPDETIIEILSNVGNGTNSTVHQLASTYINQCNGPDLTEEIQHKKAETQEYIDNIWRQISKIDSVGRAEVVDKCGNTEEFQHMLSGARDLAMSLTNIRRELSSLSKSVGCDSVHPIYTQASHDIICAETLSASAYGFLMFLIIFICLMTMVSLRASWLGNIEGEKVYHDETEVAENMVVDEHEEYLAYISRYKHEWQEYEGFDEDSSPRSDFCEQGRSGYPDCSGYYYGDGDEDPSHVSESDLSTMESRSVYTEDEQQEQLVSPRQHTALGMMNDPDDAVTYATGEISFKTFTSGKTNNEESSSPALIPLSSSSSGILPPPALGDVKDESSTTPSLHTAPTPDDWDYSNVASPRQEEDASLGRSAKNKVSKSNQKMKSLLPPTSSSSIDDSESNGDCNSSSILDFDNFLTHDLQSTGEVEVQLYEL